MCAGQNMKRSLNAYMDSAAKTLCTTLIDKAEDAPHHLSCISISELCQSYQGQFCPEF